MISDPEDFLDVRSQLSESELLVQDQVRRFVTARVLPTIAGHFDQQRFPRELVPEMAELGLFGSSLAGYGCAGLNATSYGLICQELERGDSALRSFVSVQSSLCMYPIHAYGSEQQRQQYLPDMARGKLIGCFGLTEAQGGSDPGNMRTHARRAGGDWIINGSKMWITNGSIANVAIIWAVTESGVRGFLIEQGTPGFRATDIERKYSLRASVTSALFLDEVRVPDDQVLPDAHSLKGPLSCLTQARFGIAWGVIGAALACLTETLEYTKSRTLFGRPLAQTQAAQIRLADMARRISGAQLMAWQLAQLKDHNTLQPQQVSMVKWNNCRMALDVARDCRDLLGAAGIGLEHVAMRHMLNLETVNTYEGTETIHQLTVGRALTGLSAF